MDNILISIIVPAYNIAPYIGSCLDSILAQTYSNLEIIAVDDGSTDGTSEIIDQYAVKDSRITTVHKANGGVTSARLAGIEMARGEYIGFVDGDDYIEQQMYEHLLENAVKYNADISHCGYQMVFPNRVDYYYNTGKLLQQDRITGLKELVSGQLIEPGLCNKLYNKVLFKDILSDNILPADIKINEDLLMNYWLFKAADTSVYEDFCPYHYIIREGSAAKSTINKNKLWDPLRVTRIIMTDMPTEIAPAVYQKFVRILVGGATMDYTSNPDLIKPYQSETLKELRSNLSEIVTGNKCGIKLKIMALWAAIWPASYRWVHELYLKITGLDKIYDLE